MPVEVVSAERHVLTTEATELYARSVEGEIGILPGHQPALVALDTAPLRVRTPDGVEHRIAVHQGLLFVGTDKVIVLADVAEPAEGIDVARARARLADLERRLGGGEDPVLRASMRKQQLRLDVAASLTATAD